MRPLPQTFSLSGTENLLAVYGVDGKLDPSFLKNVQEVLRDMARLAPQLTAGFEFKLNNSEPASRVSATLNLCYHQVFRHHRPVSISIHLTSIVCGPRNTTSFNVSTTRCSSKKGSFPTKSGKSDQGASKDIFRFSDQVSSHTVNVENSASSR